MGAPYGKAQGEIGGKGYTLVFDFGAMAAMERQLQMPFQDIMLTLKPNDDGTPRNPMLSVVAAVVWGLLRAKHSSVTYNEAGALMMGDDAQQLIDLMEACLEDAFPKEAGSANPPKRAKAGTGTNS